MSIINKMHQELQDTGESAPILVSMPKEKRTKKTLLFGLIFLLLITSVFLSYLIYNKQVSNKSNLYEETIQVTPELISVIPEPKSTIIDQPTIEMKNETKLKPLVQQRTSFLFDHEKLELTVIKGSEMDTDPIKPETVEVVKETIKALDIEPVNSEAVKDGKETIKALDITSVKTDTFTDYREIAEPLVIDAPPATIQTVKVKPLQVKIIPSKQESKSEVKISDKVNAPFLEIKTSTLTKKQLADIHLQKAQKALSKGEALLASQEKNKALLIKPDLHEVRKSLALYYYGLGDNVRATGVLKKGAVAFPNHADFNLMLSRIALKNGNQEKAYLYLNQHPPKVKGNLDYHVSYAILAQKFKHYAQSEGLYQGLLTQLPNNGRWIMSLAIAQDKQGKESLAIESYQKALLQIDLSSRAKKYINQRLTYLENQ